MDGESDKHPRVLLKLSGEVLAGKSGSGFHRETVYEVAKVLVEVAAQGYQLGVVTGGGNFARGRELSAFTRTQADYIGMLATVMNCIAVADSVRKHGGKASVLSAIPVPEAGVDIFSPFKAEQLYRDGHIVFFAAGTGNPLLSTDSAAALRASQTNCDIMYKGTKVDGVYDSDPMTNPDAVRFEKLSYDEVLRRNLKVMDAAAVAVSRDNKLPIIVFDITDPHNFVKVLKNHSLGTVVKGD